MRILNGELLKTLLHSAKNHLSNNQKKIDSLNVFPVPDGDTGTNMSMTFSAGANDAMNNPATDLNEVARYLSKGLLMGARGNSGVITSQIFRGFYQHLEHSKTASSYDVALAFVNGSKVAYKAIMKPVEGTILTVIREGSEQALLAIESRDVDLVEYFEILLTKMKTSLENTPNLLPILKEVGVVDSGGYGIVVIVEGMLEALKGNVISLDEHAVEHNNSAALEIENEEFGYCTEFIISLNKELVKQFDIERLRRSLSEIGNSLVAVQDEELVKVHVHTLKPGDALNIGQRYGEFIKLKIENMQQQHESIQKGVKHNSMLDAHNSAKSKSKYGVIAVATGDGLIELFKEYRSDVVVSGGQTMNPSCEDFVSAIKTLHAEHILILPNNSNIILAAKQAQDILEDIDIHVLETKSIQEGLSALTMFNPEASVEENIEQMTTSFKSIHTASLTYAIKDTSFEGVDVKTGDYIGMHDKKIIAASKDRFSVVCQIIDTFKQYEDKELITIYLGEGADLDEVEKIGEYIVKHTNFEFDTVQSNQPVYTYLFGLE